MNEFDTNNQPLNQNTTPTEQNAAPQPQTPPQPQTQSWSNTASWTTGAQQTDYRPQTPPQPQPTYTGYTPYTGSYSAQPQPQPKAKKTGIGAGLVAALLVACLVIGAGAGVGGALLVGRLNNNDRAEDEPPVVEGTDSLSETEDDRPQIGGTATFNKSEGTQVVIDRTGIGSAAGTTLSFPEVVAAVKDSVVEITTETAIRGNYFQQFVTGGAGSGVIIAKEGYVITNHHVIDGADTVMVRTTDGSEYKATLVGSDAASDVAVLKIDPTADKPLTVAVLGDSTKLMVGEDAIAIGNPLGSLGGTVTNGIISALDREIRIDGESMRLLQTNAAVNPGNSGGGLFNLAGELIGIVNAKSSGEDVEGLGFAIPINTAQAVAEQLIEFGYVRGRVDLGLNLMDITNMYDLFYYGLNTPGVYVYASPYNDQIKSGDRIQAVNGTAVSSAADVKAAYAGMAVGDVVKVSIVRRNKVIEVDVTLRELVPTASGVEFETEGAQ